MRDFSWPISSFNEAEYNLFCEKIEQNRQNMEFKKIYIFGAGIRGCCFLKFCEINEIHIEGFIDNDLNKKNGYIGKYLISEFESVIAQKDKIYIIVSAENCDAIIKQISAIKLRQELDFFFVEPCSYENFIDNFFKTEKYQKLFLGDCIFTQVSITDKKFDSLETMICNSRSMLGTRVFGMHGMPIQTFFHLIRLQVKMNNIPEKIVLVVNTVMFTGKKNMLPRAQHTPLLEEIQKRLNFVDRTFDEYIKLTKQRTEQFQTDAFVASSNSIHNRNEQHIVKLRMQLNYMYQLDEEEEGVVYLCKIAEFCEENGIKLLPVIAPINYKHGIMLFGNEFEEYCRRNISKLEYLLDRKNVHLYDASYVLGEDKFAAFDTINELANFDGRVDEINFFEKILQE